MSDETPRRLRRFSRDGKHPPETYAPERPESYDYSGVEKFSRREKAVPQKAPESIREDIIKKMRDERAAQKASEDADKAAKSGEKPTEEKKHGMFSGLFGMFGKKEKKEGGQEPQKLRLRPGQIEVQGELLSEQKKTEPQKTPQSPDISAATKENKAELMGKDREIEARKIYRDIKNLDHVQERTREIASTKVKEFKNSHGRNPSDDEFDEMAGNVYDQLKSEYSEMPWPEKDEQGKTAAGSGFRGRRERPQAQQKPDSGAAAQKPAKTDEKKLSPRERVMMRKQKSGTEEEKDSAQPAQAQTGQLPSPDNIKDVLKEEHDSLSELDELDENEGGDGLSALEGGELEGLEGGETLEEKSPKEKNTALQCPKCGKETNDVVYCPNCGQGFCEKCAKAIEKQQGAVKYTCPKCGNSFKVKTR